MNDMELRIELEALITEREAMKAHNAWCASVGDSPWYEADAFDQLAAKMRALLPQKGEAAND